LRKADGGYVAFGLQPSSIADDCERADVVVTRTTAPADCAAMVISLDELRDAGSIAMIQREGWLDVMEARPANVDRPWSRREAPRPVLNVTEPEDSAGESRARASESATPSRNAAAVDATPPSTEPGDDP
jgi:competence protein ComEC